MVITVSCPSCAASFPVDSNKVPSGGVNARCSACGTVFRIDKPAEAPPAPVEREPEVGVAEPGVGVAEPEAAEPEAAEPEVEPEPSFDAEPLPALEEEALPGLGDEPLAVEADFGPSPADEADFSVGVEAPESVDAGSDWVFETQEDIDAGSLEIAPVETVESSMAEAAAGGDFEPLAGAEPAEELQSGPEPTPEPEAPGVSAFTFGKRDPKEKARRLARVLVSDMIMYNPERHERALANGTLREDFEEEIAKSWREYVEQVGEDMANGNPFWAEALNDVLAKGEQIF